MNLLSKRPPVLWLCKSYATNSSDYCFDSVRRFDYENFLCCLLLPKEKRDAAIAIRAFNVELAQVRDVTTEKLMARMRLQFWRDSLDRIYDGKSPGHPVAFALQNVVEKYKLQKKWLKNMIDSRDETVGQNAFSSIQDLEAYAEKSNTAIYYMILQILGVKNLDVDHAASHIGKSEGIVKLIRSIPISASKRVVLIPMDIMIKHNVSQEMVIHGSREQKVKDVIYDISSSAHQHLQHAIKLESLVPRNVRVTFLSAISTSSFLQSLQLSHFDVFDPLMQQRNSLLPAKLWWSKIRRTYS